MIIKVEAYATNGSSSTTPVLIQPPLHVCLATAHVETGICLTVGRKEGLIQLEHDKSVSRRDHVILRLVSSSNNNNDDSTAAAAGGFPPVCQTPEQFEAVDSLHHLAVVLENHGKLGTVLVHEPEKQTESPTKKKTKKNNDDDDDDSATVDSAETMDEDEIVGVGGFGGAGGFASQASSASVTAATGHQTSAVLSKVAHERLEETGIAMNQVRLEFLSAGQSRVLRPLRYPNGRVILQCGKQGSTLLLTRLPTFAFVRSGFTTKKKLPWMEHLDWIGAREVTDWKINPNDTSKGKDSETNKDDDDAETVNLLITPKQEPSSKQLAAWSQHIPIVAPTFMEALLARNDPTLPLPNPKDHEPADAAKNQFWKNVTPDPKLLHGTTFVATKADSDLERLVAAAGSSVLKLYDSNAPEQDIQRVASQGGAYSLEAPRRKSTTLLKDTTIPLVSVKNIAEAISTQNPEKIHPSLKEYIANNSKQQTETKKNNNKGPFSVEKETISELTEGGGKKKTNLAEVDESESKPSSKSISKTPQPLRERNASNDWNESKSGGPSDKSSNTATTSKKGNGTGKDDPKLLSSIDEGKEKEGTSIIKDRNNLWSENPKEVVHLAVEDDDSDEDAIGRNRKKTNRAVATQQQHPPAVESSRNKSQEQLEEGQETSAFLQSSPNTTSSPPISKTKSLNATNPKKRQLLRSVGRGGWLEVAPKDKKRQTLVRSVEEIRELAGYDEVLPSAKTTTVAGMIQKLQTRGSSSSTRRTSSGESNRNPRVPDFRVFRKNAVAQLLGHDDGVGGVGGVVREDPARSQFQPACSQTSYRLIAHCANQESAAQQHEFEEQRQALEEQQRRAEALFRDSGSRSTAAGRRRRQ